MVCRCWSGSWGSTTWRSRSGTEAEAGPRSARTITAALLETRDLTVRFGGHVAVDAVSCAFDAGQLTAIVGPNGAGKSTYFNLISGQIRATGGRVLLDRSDITRAGVARRVSLGIGRGFQLTNLFPGLSVAENVALAAQARQRTGFRLLTRVAALTGLTDGAEGILERVRLGRHRDALVAGLSHGDQRKLEVALLIALDPRVSMCDEPTAGMSVDEAPVVLDLIAELKARTVRRVLLVEHKMDVIARLADRIVVLHDGALAADGAPAEVMASDVVQEAYMGRGPENV